MPAAGMIARPTGLGMPSFRIKLSLLSMKSVSRPADPLSLRHITLRKVDSQRVVDCRDWLAEEPLEIILTILRMDGAPKNAGRKAKKEWAETELWKIARPNW